MKRLIVEPMKKVYTDKMIIETCSDYVIIAVHIDGSRNNFKLTKAELKQFLFGVIEDEG